MKIKQNILENERVILINEVKSEVNFKGNEFKSNVIQELNEELTKRIENEKFNLENSLTIRYESEKLKMKDELKNALSSELHCEYKLKKTLKLAS